MSRIITPTPEQAPQLSQPLLAAVQRQLGRVPNLFRIVSNSPAALEAYIGFNGALSKGALAAATRERIALAVAEVNGCDYCLSAHSFLGREFAKLDEAEMRANRAGTSADPKAAAAVQFAAELAKTQGRVAASDVEAVREAGYSEAEIVEIIAHVALNVFTNTVNNALETAIDFPHAAALAA